MTDADPDVFRGRLHKAIGGDSLYSWANRVNLPASALRTIIRGSIPKADILAKISRATGKTIDWLLGLDVGASETHDDLPVPPPSEFVYIPYYEDVTAAHKEGAQPQRLPFQRQWIAENVKVPPTKLSVATIRGDAMAPLLQEGDDILVNHVIQRLVDSIYMISIDHQVSVKRVQWLPGNRLRLISENPAYPSYEVPTDSEDQAGFAIIGRVVWFGRLL